MTRSVRKYKTVPASMNDELKAAIEVLIERLRAEGKHEMTAVIPSLQ